MNQISDQTRSALWAAFGDGKSVHFAAEFAGVHKATARRYLRMLDPEPRCKCGSPVSHKGMCGARLALRAKRAA